jgi:hypothetical protein
MLVVLTVSPTVAHAQAAAAEPLPDQGTPLQPGRYVSNAVGPRIDFRVEDGWVVGATPAGPIFTLERSDVPGTVLSFTRFDGDAFLDSCDSTSLVTVESSVQRLAEIIGGNPYVNPGRPQAIVVDSYPGLWLDAGIPAYTECALPWLLLWALPIGEGGEFVQVADQQSRFVILDVEGDVLVVAIESFPGVPFGGLLEASMDLVESMRIEPGEYIPPEPTQAPIRDAAASPSPSAAPPDQTA